MEGGEPAPTRRSPTALDRLEEQAGKKLGDPEDPLLVSVRSGARESMPGMLDTVLNLGLNDESVEGLGGDRFAWDSYRRFVQMFGNVCRGIKGERFEDLIKERKGEAGVKEDVELDVDDLKALTDELQARLPGGDRRGLPAGPARAAAPGDPRRVRLVDGRARRPVPAHQPDPGRVGHGGERAADGVRQPRRAARAAAWRSRATRSPARPSPRATSCRTPRARTWCRACARRATSHEMKDVDARGLRRADGDPAHARAALPGHAGHRVHRRGGHASTCSRRATPSGRRRRRCASRWTRWRRGCSTRPRRSCTIDAGEARRAAPPRLRARTPTSRSLAEGVAGSPGRGAGARSCSPRTTRSRPPRTAAT